MEYRMREYIVYGEWNDELVPFKCQAEDSEHAEEQMDNAYPGVEITETVYAEDVNF